VPEIIAYNRVLNSRERLQVASYLALKYGITLTEPAATYVNSAGEKIWDGYDYKTWHRNIAGICRDDSAGLNQTISTSSNMPGLLTIATREQPANNSFLMWGDNGKPLTPGPKTAGLPLLLQKTWLMKTYGNIQPFATDIVINTKQVDAKLPVNPVYWLVIDHSGEGKFNTAGAEYIKMEKTDRQGNTYFKNILWDKDGTGKDVWSIVIAQDLLLATTINQPTCTPAQTGSLDVKILGGKAPYQLIIRGTAGQLINRRIDDISTPLHVADLRTGKYLLAVTDASQHHYIDSFYINHEDVPLPATMEDSYTMPAGRLLTLNAAQHISGNVSWEWSGPGNFHSFNPEVNISTPGVYTIRCSKNGCINEQDVLIKAPPSNILYDITVFPNPSPSAFNARITLDKPAPVLMTVYGPDGKLITTQKGNGRANYLFTGTLKASGTYEMVFTSGLSKTNKRLVIVK
jgi:hypothetical protein